MHSTLIKHRVYQQTLQLLPQKAIFWEEQQALLIANLHIGKVRHFHKAGIPIPDKTWLKDLLNLQALLTQYQVKTCYFLGDLFHSVHNSEWEVLAKLLATYPHIKFHLIRGNHDHQADDFCSQLPMSVHPESLLVPPFHLIHEPLPAPRNTDYYTLAGHIHPGVRLDGLGQQQMCLPCFYFAKQQGILPAFAQFSGLGIVQPKKEDQVFVIAEEQVIEVS